MSSDEYLVKEADYLRQLYADSAKEIWDVERYSLLTTGAIWSWSAAHMEDSGSRIILWIPVIVTILFGLRAWGTYKKIAIARSYLAALEDAASLPPGLGWERHFAERAGHLRTVTGFVFWGLITLLTLIVAGVAAVVNGL